MIVPHAGMFVKLRPDSQYYNSQGKTQTGKARVGYIARILTPPIPCNSGAKRPFTCEVYWVGDEWHSKAEIKELTRKMLERRDAQSKSKSLLMASPSGTAYYRNEDLAEYDILEPHEKEEYYKDVKDVKTALSEIKTSLNE